MRYLAYSSMVKVTWRRSVTSLLRILKGARSPNIYISPRVAVVALSTTDQPVRGGLSAIRYRRSRAAPPRVLPARSWDAGVPLRDPPADPRGHGHRPPERQAPRQAAQAQARPGPRDRPHARPRRLQHRRDRRPV